MEKIIIACETLKDELNTAINNTGCRLPIIWIDSKYHIEPGGLRKKLQQEIDSVNNADKILLAFGCCGNAMIGIKASTADLIIPKTDDCISMVLSKQGEKFKRAKKTYFLTKGWIESSRSLAAEYQRAVERYGKEKSEKIFKFMLNSYKYLMLIDTRAYDVEKYKSKAEKIAQITNMELIIEKGSLWFLEKLLTGPHDENFCIIPKGQEVKICHFGYDNNHVPNKSINLI
ncbi:MAG: DUF1638 domain-containing protein [Thermoanaerobacteraceae bacterium]|nr:DUF1638 domain-containing protein [Thermoanaerobacteraceae bacterium]